MAQMLNFTTHASDPALILPLFLFEQESVCRIEFDLSRVLVPRLRLPRRQLGIIKETALSPLGPPATIFVQTANSFQYLLRLWRS
jgi:hypothetical protein